MDKDFNYLFNDAPLYVKEEFKVLELDKNGKYQINETEKNRFVQYINDFNCF